MKRLKRIEGQVRGIQKMIENGRDCESVITQLAAFLSAIENVGTLMLNNYMKFCFLCGVASRKASIFWRSLLPFGAVCILASD